MPRVKKNMPAPRLRKNPIAFAKDRAQNQFRQMTAPQPDRGGLPMRTPNQGMAPLAQNFMNRGVPFGRPAPQPPYRGDIRGAFGRGDVKGAFGQRRADYEIDAYRDRRNQYDNIRDRRGGFEYDGGMLQDFRNRRPAQPPYEELRDGLDRRYAPGVLDRLRDRMDEDFPDPDPRKQLQDARQRREDFRDAVDRRFPEPEDLYGQVRDLQRRSAGDYRDQLPRGPLAELRDYRDALGAGPDLRGQLGRYADEWGMTGGPRQPAPAGPFLTRDQVQTQTGTNNVGVYADALVQQYGSIDAAMAAIMGGVTPDDPNWGAVWNAATPEQRSAYSALHSAQRFGHGTWDQQQPQAPAPQPGPQQSSGWPTAPQPPWQQIPIPRANPMKNPPQGDPRMRLIPHQPFSEGSGANAASQGPNAPQGFGQDQARAALNHRAPLVNAGVDPQGKGRSQASPKKELGLPLSPEFEAGRRALDDELAGTLSSLGVAEQDVQAMVELAKQRLATDLAEEIRQVDENANARGLYDSGIRTSNRDKTQLGYDRRTQDLAMEALRQLREIAAGKSGAQSSYMKGLAELLMESARGSAVDENAVTARPGSRKTKKKTPAKKTAARGKGRSQVKQGGPRG